MVSCSDLVASSSQSCRPSPESCPISPDPCDHTQNLCSQPDALIQSYFVRFTTIDRVVDSRLVLETQNLFYYPRYQPGESRQSLFFFSYPKVRTGNSPLSCNSPMLKKRIFQHPPASPSILQHPPALLVS